MRGEKKKGGGRISEEKRERGERGEKGQEEKRSSCKKCTVDFSRHTTFSFSFSISIANSLNYLPFPGTLEKSSTNL